MKVTKSEVILRYKSTQLSFLYYVVADKYMKTPLFADVKSRTFPTNDN
jgi:hypothetical protein